MHVRAHLASENRAALDALTAAVAAGDAARFARDAHALHVFAHDDAAVHAALHRLELASARARGDVGAAVKSLAPVAFAGLVSRLEAAGPSYEAEAFAACDRATVFEVMTDFAAYPAWNPWIVEARGPLEVSGRVAAQVVLSGETRAVDHVVEAVVPDERFAWRDAGWFTPLARGRRLRWLADEAGGTRLRVRLAVSGPLAWLVDRLHGPSLVQGLEAETAALVARAESVAAARRSAGGAHGAR